MLDMLNDLLWQNILQMDISQKTPFCGLRGGVSGRHYPQYGSYMRGCPSRNLMVLLQVNKISNYSLQCAVDSVSHFLILFADLPDEDDDFTKWQKEVQEAEAAAEALKNGTTMSVLAEGGEGLQEGAGLGADDQPTTPPDGEEEFTDDDGSTYKWDRALRKWVPQVSA